MNNRMNGLDNNELLFAVEDLTQEEIFNVIGGETPITPVNPIHPSVGPPASLETITGLNGETLIIAKDALGNIVQVGSTQTPAGLYPSTKPNFPSAGNRSGCMGPP